MGDIAFRGISIGFWGILRDFRSLRVFNDFKGFKGLLRDITSFGAIWGTLTDLQGL